VGAQGLPLSSRRPADGPYSGAPQADWDLDDIWYYIATRSASIETAVRFVDSITDRFVLLASQPNMERARNDDLRSGLRSFALGEYIIG
jgi:plasmid stabilization system protein ParE